MIKTRLENASIPWEEFEKKTNNDNPFAEVLAKFEDENENLYDLSPGKIMNGVVHSKTDKFLIISINRKSDVFIQNNIYERSHIDNLNVGDSVDFVITEIVDKTEFIIYGSIYSLKIKEARTLLNNAVDDKTVLVGTPTAMNFAGYTVNVNINDNDISIFMPHVLADINKLPDQSTLLNTEIKFILERTYKNGKDIYIASRKAYLKSIIDETISSLDKTKIYSGFVTGSRDFGIFVQFEECLTAMMHKSNLSADGQKMLANEEIKPGMLIDFYIKDISSRGENTKIYITQLVQESLWDEIEENDIITGVVSSIKPFGVLVKLDYETKGLIHKSILNNHDLKVGDEVEVVVLEVNKNNRQISLELHDEK
jgi:ribosomal protein S1